MGGRSWQTECSKFLENKEYRTQTVEAITWNKKGESDV